MRHQALIALAALSITGMANAETPLKPPQTPAEIVTDTVHGTRIQDPYRWLEDQDSPKTRAWLKDQIAYTEGYLKTVPERQAFAKRLTELLRIDSMGAPAKRGNRYFLSKRAKTENQASIYLREGLTGADKLLVDGNKDPKTSVMLMDVSDDGTLIAYGVRQGGEDEVAVKLLDVDTGKLLPDAMDRARYFGFSLSPDKKAVYYSKQGTEGARVYRHLIGQPSSQDKLLFGEGREPQWLTGASISDNGRWLLISSAFGVPAKREEVYVKDLQSDGPVVPVITGIDANFNPQFFGDTLYVHTDWNAPNYRVLRIDPTQPDRQNWTEVIPESKAVLQGLSIVGGKLFADYLDNVQTKISIFDAAGKPQGEMELPGLGIASAPGSRENEREAFFSFQSPTTPPTIYRYDTQTGQRSVWFQPNIPVNSAQMESRQVWYTSKDGTKVPMTITLKKGTKLDGTHPTLLYGYGGFNVSSLPTFNSTAAAWVDQGGIWAQANLRGGGEFGEAWHKAGMFERKQNVFDDFIAAAEYLIKEKYTAPKHLAIMGGSNGGLLVGAVMTQRPELFGAVVCQVPLLDMVRFHKFKVGNWWTAEYGTPESPEDFAYIYKYSPYHRVVKGTKYPAVMFKTGDADTRVDPLHARKMAALMQASTGSHRPVLLHYDLEVGHSAGIPLDKVIATNADVLAFLARETK